MKNSSRVGVAFFLRLSLGWLNALFLFSFFFLSFLLSRKNSTLPFSSWRASTTTSSRRGTPCSRQGTRSVHIWIEGIRKAKKDSGDQPNVADDHHFPPLDLVALLPLLFACGHCSCTEPVRGPAKGERD